MMGSVNRFQLQPKPTRPDSDADDPPPGVATRLTLDGSDEDSALAGSDFLSREEVLRRRLRRVNQLTRYYRDQYWALMEELRSRHRKYYWDHGRSPFKEDLSAVGGGSGGDGVDGEDAAEGKNWPGSRCAFPACKSKAMALTRYCHAHILSDTKQKLYKPCIAPVGQVTCGKPILRASVPSLCNSHLQKHQKNIWRALKKGGLNMTSSSKPPKFSVIISEYVRQIQTKRRVAYNTNVENTTSIEENGD